MNKVVTFIVGLAIGLGLMAFIGARERTAADAVHAKELESARQDVCLSLGYHHVEQVNQRWTCMDIDPDDEDGHEHEHDEGAGPGS